MTPETEAIIAQHREAWDKLVAQHRAKTQATTQAFIEECIQRTNEEITTREQACIEEFEASMTKLEQDRQNPKIRAFITDGRERSIKNQF